jgi:Flp pilus assembly protein CpaB
MNGNHLFSLIVVLLCVGGIVLVARRTHLKHQDAGDGWRYIYWQPWRAKLMLAVLVAFVLFNAVVAVAIWLDPAPPVVQPTPAEVPVPPVQSP